jgi:hypothetical protein
MKGFELFIKRVKVIYLYNKQLKLFRSSLTKAISKLEHIHTPLSEASYY